MCVFLNMIKSGILFTFCCYWIRHACIFYKSENKLHNRPIAKSEVLPVATLFYGKKFSVWEALKKS